MVAPSDREAFLEASFIAIDTLQRLENRLYESIEIATEMCKQGKYAGSDIKPTTKRVGLLLARYYKAGNTDIVRGRYDFSNKKGGTYLYGLSIHVVPQEQIK